jgi:hypothetical protein
LAQNVPFIGLPNVCVVYQWHLMGLSLADSSDLPILKQHMLDINVNPTLQMHLPQ